MDDEGSKPYRTHIKHKSASLSVSTIPQIDNPTAGYNSALVRKVKET